MGGTRILGSQLTVDAPGGMHFVGGSWLPQTAAQPTAVKGKGFTVLWVSAGLWTVTLERTYSTFITGFSSLTLHTMTSFGCHLGDIDVSGAGTVQVYTDVTGTPTDPTPNANTRVAFGLFLSDTVLNA